MKNRFGPDGITFPCKMDTNTGFIEVYEGTSVRVYFLPKEAKASGNIERKKLLHKKYVESMDF